jgi:DNA-binding transcriptional MerR regulator
MHRIPQAGLTISAVSARTGVSVPVLRSWEERYGFPSPERLPGGHRRYSESDVDQILRVLQERADGRSLRAAIEAAIAIPSSAAGSPTLFAGLRRLRPDLPTQVIGRRTMLAISLAIEDECLARAERAHLAAAFQHEEVFRRAQPRWEGLARTAHSTLVFADFARSRRDRSGIGEVAIPADDPLHREWSVVCDAPGAAAVMAGWERQDGRFECLWSVDPEVVRAATLASRELAARMAPRLRLPEGPTEAPWHRDPDRGIEAATALTNRIVAYLDAGPIRGTQAL